jgi:glycosyltransferase involved in cell wall biosynthesis
MIPRKAPGMRRPLFSVLIPTYNRQQLLSEAIDSVLSQTMEDFECIVIDDASPKPLVVPDHPRIKLVRRDTNGGPPAARNTGLDHASGRYIAFLDSDDLFTPDRLALALAGLEQAPVALCWTAFLGEEARPGRFLTGNVYDSIADALIPHLGTTAIVNELAPRFDERFMAVQDVDWWMRVAAIADVVTIPRVGYLFRRHPETRHVNSTEAHIAGNLLLLKKHDAYFQMHPDAAGFRWKRIGLKAQTLGDYALARRAFIRSSRLRPELKTLWHVGRSFRTSRARLQNPIDL